MRIRCLGIAAAVCGLMVASPTAHAGLLEWQSEVALETAAGYVNTGIVSPIVADIGTYDEASGISYEFIVNATNDGASSALIGVRSATATGDNAAIKWEQYLDTGTFGATEFGVVDYDSLVPNTPGVDTHLVFVNDGTDTAIWINGVLAGSITGASPTLSGLVGIGQAYDPAGNFDLLTGEIIGVAIYDEALSAAEISAHADAFFVVPEPSSVALAGIAFAAFGIVAKRRKL